MKVELSYISGPIILIIQNYLLTNNSICIFWNDNFDLNLKGLVSDVASSIQMVSVHIDDYLKDYSNFLLRLSELMENTTCESFIVFEDDITMFLDGFMNVSYGLEKRQKFHKFLFVFSEEVGDLSDHPNMDHRLLHYLPNILMMQSFNESEIVFWVKKYNGPTSDDFNKLELMDKYFVENSSFLYNTNLYPDKIYNLMGKHLTFGAFDYRPFVVVSNDLEPNTIEITDGANRPIFLDGTEARLIMYFCQKHNCTVDMFIDYSEDWGTAYFNMSGEGLLGNLNKGNLEIAMNAIYLWYKEYLHFDITVPLSKSGVTNIVPVPLNKPSLLLPIEPFSSSLWFAVFICLISEFISLFFCYWVHLLQKPTKTKESLEFGFGAMLRIFLSQGFKDILSYSPLRLILFACLTVDLILTIAYSSGLASILTLPSFEEPTDTVDRLIKHKMTWFATAPNWAFAIEKSDEPIILKVLELFRVDTSSESLERKAYTENIALVVERLTFGHLALPSYITHENAKRLQVMKEDIYFNYCVGMVPKLWPYLENFDKFVLTAQATGLVEHWERECAFKYLDNNIYQIITNNGNPEDSGPQKLGVSNFIGMALIWIFGCITSIFAFLLEIVCFKLRKNVPGKCENLSES